MVNVRGGFLGSFRWRTGKWMQSLKLQLHIEAGFRVYAD